MGHHAAAGRAARSILRIAPAVLALILPGITRGAFADWPQVLTIRGRPQTVMLYGPRTGPPVLVSSGDGGWLHLGPVVAEFLASRGYFVVGFDVRAYLSGFTGPSRALSVEEEPRDYQVLAEFARRAGNGEPPILVGVSEGAGLSVLAATDPGTKRLIAGIVALGLPDLNELGWRWRDSIIYLTHGMPNEPSFSSAAVVGRIAPLPLAAIHATRDEFVALAEVQRVLASANEPKRLWTITASNHRFSDNVAGLENALIEAMAWVRQNAPK